MKDKLSEMREKVAARTSVEKSRGTPRKTAAESIKSEITDRDLEGYLNENRVGDAKLYCRLFRGKIVYVKYWERFLVWGGHHWMEDDYNQSKQNIGHLRTPFAPLR